MRQVMVRYKVKPDRVVENEPQPDGDFPFDEKRIEGIEGARLRKPDVAALWCVGVYIAEMLEAGCIFELVDERQAVMPGRFLRVSGLRQ